MGTVSAWAKPGTWALDAEEHEAATEPRKEDKGYDSSDSASASHHHHQPSADFPSLDAASKISKKKKSQRLSLAEFTTGSAVTHGAGRLRTSSSSKGLTTDDPLVLPRAPRERSAEDLERYSSRGFGYSSYGGGVGGRGRISGDDSNSRWGSSRVSDEPRRGVYGGEGSGSNRDLGPSRADEIDDWGAAKKSAAPERRDRGGVFFDSHSRADESDSWISSKSAARPSDGRRTNGGGFDGPRERRGGFDKFNREGSNGGPDLDTWAKKREEASSGGRPRLVLQPRSLPLANGRNEELSRGEQPKGPTEKSKGSNPFGGARPREEVLAEKGQDWKNIDEKLEAMKIQEAPPERPSFGKMGNGAGSLPEDRTGRSWRKADTIDATPLPRTEKDEMLPEN
ncbi:eukaryotic translation initiation factor 4B3-like [Phoenix dactylifera]|uniref:Eukaryotic translation initiation factor 4B3-like n=1 Tax=Phoenix dactylifera TaxID=42345 RepID=A0A8B8ZR58_PHODC|nr:eukaryotic translation initiation factor 4B3-like [Phoenix dactylifera]